MRAREVNISRKIRVRREWLDTGTLYLWGLVLIVCSYTLGHQGSRPHNVVDSVKRIVIGVSSMEDVRELLGRPQYSVPNNDINLLSEETGARPRWTYSEGLSHENAVTIEFGQDKRVTRVIWGN